MVVGGGVFNVSDSSFYIAIVSNKKKKYNST